MNFILLHWNFGRESCRMIADNMEEPVGLLLKKKSGDWYSYAGGDFYPLDSIMKILRDSDYRVINWGNRIFSDDGFFSANLPSSIANASNKTRCRRILREAGIEIPVTYFYQEDFTCEGINEGPIIARPSSHHGGSDFYIIDSTDEYMKLSKRFDLRDWYFSEIFEKTHEYRLHVMSGKVSVIQEKPLVDGEIRANYAVNHESWRILKWSEYNHSMCRTAIKALEILGLDFGAVDMLYNEKNDTWAICEVNTSPAVNSPYMSGKYAAYFDWLIRHDFPEPFSSEEENVTFYTKLLRE